MSIPPNPPPFGSQPPYGTPPNTPPGGYYPASPPRSSGGGSGWKIAGFGCLGLFLLLAVGGVLLVRNVKSSLAHPSKNSLLGIGIIAGQTALQGRQIAEAVTAYHAQHGHYPQTLMDLYTGGAIDGKLLHNDLDDSPDPAHVSWRYFPPAEGAPGEMPILEEPYHVTVGSNTAPGKIIIDLDGRSQAGSSRRYAPSGGSDQSGSGQ